MKAATLMLCLMTGFMTSGCIIHHTETRQPRREEPAKPEGVAMRPAADSGTAR